MQRRAGDLTGVLPLVAAVGLIVGPIASSFVPATPPTTSTRTEVINVAPVNARDELANGYALTYYHQPAHCFGWLWGMACLAGNSNRGGGTCWPWKDAVGKARTSLYVLCMNNITEKSAIGMRTGHSNYAIPSLSHFASWVPTEGPEAVGLRNGANCFAFEGTPDMFEDQVIRYDCTDNVGLLDSSIIFNEQSLWTAQSVVYEPKANTYRAGPRVQIAKAWFYVLHV